MIIEEISDEELSKQCIMWGVLCTTCGILEKLGVSFDAHKVTIWCNCIICGTSKRRFVKLSLDYFKEDQHFKYLTKEEMIELLI